MTFVLMWSMQSPRVISTKKLESCEGKSASDIALVLTSRRQDALNNEDDTVVVALDIAEL